ncbi:MAG: helix-turn-helix transcriptional regulator [Bacteroidales bacterium]|nr:helix-turn-helix transcriptional regulator [Bacteroidales bacterium]
MNLMEFVKNFPDEENCKRKWHVERPAGEGGRRDDGQGELAEKIGVTRQAVNYIELGKYVPSTLLAPKMARYFGKTVEELFMLEEED